MNKKTSKTQRMLFIFFICIFSCLLSNKIRINYHISTKSYLVFKQVWTRKNIDFGEYFSCCSSLLYMSSDVTAWNTLYVCQIIGLFWTSLCLYLTGYLFLYSLKNGVFIEYCWCRDMLDSFLAVLANKSAAHSSAFHRNNYYIC